MRRRAVVTFLAAILWPLGAAIGDTYLLVVSGVGGEESYSQSFYEWSLALLDAALEAGVKPENLIYLAEEPDRNPDRIRGESTRENVSQAVAELVEQAGEMDQLWIVLFGHGSARNGQNRFNLLGPDMNETDFASLLAGASARTLSFVNASSSSAGFVPALSSPNRIVVTATRSDSERHATRFGEFFSKAFSNGEADVDKDDRVSLLEAFNYARIEVDRDYRDAGLLPTEHALLDDDGDGEGSLEPSQEGGDGRLASRTFLARGAEGQAMTSPELAKLLEQREALEDRIAVLRSQKESLDEGLYLEELEELLLALARKGEAIRVLSETSE